MGRIISMPRRGLFADVAEVFCRQGRVSVEEPGTQPELADVVEESGKMESPALVLSEAKAPRHHVGEGSHPPGMAVIPCIVGIEQRNEHLTDVGREVLCVLGRMGVDEGNCTLLRKGGEQGDIIVVETPFSTGRHQYSDDSGGDKRSADEAWQTRTEIITPRRVARVVPRVLELHRHILFEHPTHDPIAHAESAALRDVAVAEGLTNGHVSEVAAIHEDDSNTLGIQQLPHGPEKAVEEQIRVVLPSQSSTPFGEGSQA
jgi:hypothetical protein